MSDPVTWLRVSYWTGAVVDALAAIQMVCPPLFSFAMGLPGFAPGPEYRYAMGMGASLMLGWTVLLLWADRKPLERKGVLLLTVLPVIAGLATNQARGVLVRFVPLGAVVPIWGLQLGLCGLFLASYVRARRAAG